MQRYILNPWFKGNAHNSEQNPLLCWKCLVSIGYPTSIFCGYILHQKRLPSTECLFFPPPSSTFFMPFPFLLPPITHGTLTHAFSPLFLAFLWLLGNSRNQAICPDREEKFFDSALQEDHWSPGDHRSRKTHWIFHGAMQLSWDGRQAGIWRSNSLAQMSASPWD